MTFYLQIRNKDGSQQITDIIEYAYGDYTPIELQLPLPERILTGEYELKNGQLIYREDWKVPDQNSEIEQKISNIETTIRQTIFLEIEMDYNQPIEIVKGTAVAKTKAWVAKQLAHGVEFNSKLYNATMEKQGLLTAQLGLYTMNKQIGIDIPLTWNATGETCEEWTFENLVMLSNTIATFVAILVKKQQYSEIDILSCNTIEQVKNIMVEFE